MKFLYSILVVLALTTVLGGQDPAPPDPVPISISAPSECVIGELVRLDARDSSAALTWRVLPATDDFEVIEDGKRAFFSSRVPGEYLFIIAGAEDGKAYLETLIVKVKGKVVPPSRLTQLVGEWLKKLPAEVSREPVPSIAGVFRRLATGETEVENMLSATALATSAVLGEAEEDWKPFLNALGFELDRLADAGELETLEQYQTLWLQIADALEQNYKGE